MSPSYGIRIRVDSSGKKTESQIGEVTEIEIRKEKESQPPSKIKVPTQNQAPTQTTVSVHGSDEVGVTVVVISKEANRATRNGETDKRSRKGKSTANTGNPERGLKQMATGWQGE